ncbi:MAG: hypothetical protein O3B04_06590 [Chloroflexi bacterium]|nr:hypothetical protein [Chloroflexota bacterium]
MAKHHVPPLIDHSKLARLRRELRNPSKLTVFLIIAAVLAVPLGLLVPSWISTTQQSFQDRNESDALRDSTILSSNVLVPSQIAPWMLNQITRLEEAKGPFDWNFASFTAGPCDPGNLVQLPPGQYSAAIANACSSLQQIQVEFADDCASVAACQLSDAAVERLAAVRTDLVDAFSDAGFVLPYSDEEEQVGP